MKRIIFCLFCALLGSVLCMAQEKRQDLIRQIRELEEIYSQQESLLNEGHVYVGELKRKRTVLTSRYKERNDLPYKKVDIRLLKEINIPSPRIKVVSSIPKNSYKISHPDSTSSRITILDVSSFWYRSNKLIVQTYYQTSKDSTAMNNVIEENIFNDEHVVQKPRKTHNRVLGNKVSMKSLVLIRDSLQTLVEKQDSILNVCYILVGTRIELKELGIISGGPFRKMEVDPSALDERHFTSVDMRQVTEIPIPFSKKARLLLPAPADSYHFERGDTGNITTLVIDNPTRFWSLSRYQVIQY